MATSSRRLPLLLVLGCLALPVAAAAAGVSKGGAPPTGASVTELDEVDVVGKTLRKLEHELIEAEDRFYKRYNTLNTKDDFDIHCDMEKPIGTLVPQRQCRIQFLVKAEAIDAQEFYAALTTPSSPRGVHTPLAVLLPAWLERRDEYRQTVKALLEKDPELMALANEWVRRQQQYDRVCKERQKNRIIQF